MKKKVVKKIIKACSKEILLVGICIIFFILFIEVVVNLSCSIDNWFARKNFNPMPVAYSDISIHYVMDIKDLEKNHTYTLIYEQPTGDLYQAKFIARVSYGKLQLDCLNWEFINEISEEKLIPLYNEKAINLSYPGYMSTVTLYEDTGEHVTGFVCGCKECRKYPEGFTEDEKRTYNLKEDNI